MDDIFYKDHYSLTESADLLAVDEQTLFDMAIRGTVRLSIQSSYFSGYLLCSEIANQRHAQCLNKNIKFDFHDGIYFRSSGQLFDIHKVSLDEFKYQNTIKIAGIKHVSSFTALNKALRSLSLTKNSCSNDYYSIVTGCSYEFIQYVEDNDRYISLNELVIRHDEVNRLKKLRFSNSISCTYSHEDNPSTSYEDSSDESIQEIMSSKNEKEQLKKQICDLSDKCASLELELNTSKKKECIAENSKFYIFSTFAAIKKLYSVNVSAIANYLSKQGVIINESTISNYLSGNKHKEK